MTLPAERVRAQESVRDLLTDLLYPAKTPRVPAEVRHRAGRCLRHFASAFDVEQGEQATETVSQLKADIAARDARIGELEAMLADRDVAEPERLVEDLPETDV